MSDKPAEKSDKPIIKLNNAAALRLAQLITMPFLDNPDYAYKCGAFSDDHLNDIPLAPLQPGRDAKPDDWRTWDKEYSEWGKQPFPDIITTVKRKQALRALISKAVEKVQISGALGDRTLLRALEIASDD